MNLTIPEPSLVLLIGPSGSGKTTFAARHFLPTEVVSSDLCRRLVWDDDNNMEATPAAFRVLRSIARERLRLGRMVVIDATNVRPASRKPLVALARKHHRPAIAIAFELPLELCLARNRARVGRSVPDDVVRRQHAEMARSLGGLEVEGFQSTHIVTSADAVDSAVIVRAQAI